MNSKMREGLEQNEGFVCEESDVATRTSINDEHSETSCKGTFGFLKETTLIKTNRRDDKRKKEKLRKEKDVGGLPERTLGTRVSQDQLEVRGMLKNASTREDIRWRGQQMESIEENSELLKRGDDPQIHKEMEEENQKTSVEELNAEKIILLKEKRGKLAMKLENFKRKIWELEEEKKDLAHKAKSHEREFNLQRNYKTKIKKKCEVAMVNQRTEEKVQCLEIELKDLAIKYKNCRVRNQRLDNQIRENAKKCESFQRRIQELRVKNDQWERKNELYHTELLKFKEEMSELTTLAICLNANIQEKHERNQQLAQKLKQYEVKVKELKEIQEGMAMEKKKAQELEEKLKELAIKYETCEVRNQQLDNQMNEQARKCEDLEMKIQKLEKEKGGSFRREIQREGECNAASEDFERELEVLKEDGENMVMTAEYYEKKVQDLEKANQRLSQRELNYEEKISQIEEEKNTLDVTNQCHETMIQLLKEEMEKMAKKEERIEIKLDLLEMQNSDLKNICKRLLKKTKKTTWSWSLFRKGKKKEEKQAKETRVEMRPDKEWKEKKKGGLMKWIRGLWT